MRHPTNVGHDSLRTDKNARTDITVLARRKIGLADHHKKTIVPQGLGGRCSRTIDSLPIVRLIFNPALNGVLLAQS
jgi:hypothetical protein